MKSYYHIGDIRHSRFWLSVQFYRWRWWRRWFTIGATYNGTKTGINIGLPFMVVLGHIR